MMKTVVLDDDPTGTQSAQDVTVLLSPSKNAIREVLRTGESVYVQTNTRALGESDARALVARIRAQATEAAASLGADVQFVLRGDSTLRGHVFAELEQFASPADVIVFAPAFPDGGRTTEGGVHYVDVRGSKVPAHLTEFAADPVFPFDTADLVEYVRRKSGRTATSVPLAVIRTPDGFLNALKAAEAGSILIPDAATNGDLQVVARDIRAARASGVTAIVRCAAPLAASLAGAESAGLLPPLAPRTARKTLLVCGSHTEVTTSQLAAISGVWPAPLELDAGQAIEAPDAVGVEAGRELRRRIEGNGFAAIATSRLRSMHHGTLAHGSRVMTALTTAVREVTDLVDIVVAKGGITSAEVARVGLGAERATVLGQALPGISVWNLERVGNRPLTYLVVPGNVGGPNTLLDALAWISGGA